MTKTIKEIAQNKCNKAFAKQVIEGLSDKEKLSKIRKFERIGYDYNDCIHILLKEDTVIPYDYVLYCLLIENANN